MQRPAGRRFLLRSTRQHFSCSARAILDRLPVVQPIPLEWPSGKIRPRCREKKQPDRPTSQTPHALFPRPRRPQANCYSESIPAFHSRVDATNAVQWYDITDDGRYTETRTTTSLSAPQHQRIWPPYSRLGSTEQEFASRTPASNLHTGPGKRLMSRERPTRCQAPQQLTSTMMVRCLALHGCWSTNHPGGQAISGIRKIIVTLTNRTTPERLTGSRRGWVWPTAGGVRCQFKSQKDTVPRSG